MRRSITKFVVAWLLGCLGALLSYPLIRRVASPWASIDETKIVMLASDYCPTSRKALRLIETDPRLSSLLIPVPADGAEVDQPRTCAASLAAIGSEHVHVRWLPENLACRWLEEDVDRALDHESVPTPSWYFRGQLITYQDEDEERELFERHGWDIEWTALGLRLAPSGSGRNTSQDEGAVERIEDLGVDPFRPAPI